MATHPTQYAHPEALVETDWLEKHLNDDGIRIIESNEDILLYDTGHIPGAVHIDWRADLQDPVIRDYISPEKFARLCSRHGITPETTCIFYGDKANWWACYALWAFRLFGHEKVKILNGGRDKWKAEQRPMTREVPKYPETNYPVPKKRFDKEIRAFFDEALAQSKGGKPLIDVRSPGEYKGEITHMPEYPQEGVLRGGHIPGAKSMPWKTATNDDATFKSGRRAGQNLSRSMRRKTGHRHGRLLPDWRAIEPHLVCAHLSARARQRPQLRRFMDRMGQ